MKCSRRAEIAQSHVIPSIDAKFKVIMIQCRCPRRRYASCHRTRIGLRCCKEGSGRAPRCNAHEDLFYTGVPACHRQMYQRSGLRDPCMRCRCSSSSCIRTSWQKVLIVVVRFLIGPCQHIVLSPMLADHEHTKKYVTSSRRAGVKDSASVV